MTNADISRFLVQPRKHYVGARMQQGRVVIDSDFNEEAELGGEDQRRALADVIGPTGSPDDGFAADLAIGDEVTISSITINGGAATDVLNYRIRPGTMYIAGLRFDHEERVLNNEAGGDFIAFQRDFLQLQPEDLPLSQPGITHSHMTYLHGWEQWISAVEDEEIRERALGGIDTSVRVRRMGRVELREVDNDLDCAQAWAAIAQQLETQAGGAFDATGVEMISSARLRVTFVPGESLDPCGACAPDDVGRYLGAENQAIRIMLAGPNSYVWGLDNASPLYRVQVGEAADGMVPIRMITEPRDEAHWPLTGTVVEFVPWSALLDNNEKCAGDVGVFLRVVEGYDPDAGSFRIDEIDAGQLGVLVTEWDPAHSDIAVLPNTADPNGRYLYMRVWHRLDEGDTNVLLSTAAGPNNHTLLRRLGLQPEFSGVGRPGDYWVVTVRPNTPQTVAPWNLTQLGGVPPHGPRHFYAPLSLITFRPPQGGEHANTQVVQSIHDCRRLFRPLIDRGGCCTLTVGDGVDSRGDYLSIQTAIDNLPVEGGKICVLAGIYTEAVRIERADVIIEGCGLSTRIRTPSGDTSPALLHVLGARITLRDFVLETAGQIGVLAGEEDLNADVVATDLLLERLTVRADERAGVGGQTRTALDVRRADRVTIRECDVTVDGSTSDEAGVFVRGSDIRVEACRVETLATTDAYAAWGGIQIGGGSNRIQLRRNRITGGVGHGVTLGSLEWIAETSTSTSFGAGTGIQSTVDPCAPLEPTVQPVEVENTRFDPETAGDLDDILILDNRIESMQGNGISVLTTLELNDDGTQDMITVDRLNIERNRIFNCVVQSKTLASNSPVQKTKKLAPGEEEVFGQFLVSSIPPAGIALVDGERIVIRDNDIRDNGTTDPDPVCGIIVIFGNDIVIEGNRIQNNGLRQPASIASISSMRSAIAISLAGVASNEDNQDQADEMGTSLRVIGNIVEHPNGPALAVRATGPVAIENNYLMSLGNNATSQVASTAHGVAVLNVGTPWESIDLPPGEPSTTRWVFPAGTPEYLQREPGSGDVGGVGAPGEGGIVGQGGPVLFNNNHVTLRWVETGSSAGSLASGFSTGICSLDDVTLVGNQFALNIEDPGLKKKSGTTFARQPRISAQVVAVGATTKVAHNRVAEGVNDALISLLALGGFMVSASYNLTTHMSYAATCNGLENAPESIPPAINSSDQYRVYRGNLIWLRPAQQTSASDLVSVETVNATAAQLMTTLCSTCLGLGSSEGGFINLGPLLSLFTIRTRG